MKIVYKTGDLLEAPERTICHGCNAQGKMGAGIAVPIKKRYPMAFDAYRQLYEAQGNRLELGQAIWVSCPDGRTVINAIIQEFYGREPGVVYVSYPAIRSVIDQIDIWRALECRLWMRRLWWLFRRSGLGLRWATGRRSKRLSKTIRRAFSRWSMCSNRAMLR
jgi:hypothetical protein